ncbi:hypothetical protein JL108_05175 [Aeromicrobium sp. YIM 150415]|uniref:hypothetical protein n=1 Tax=Aeromicrobium sp. YIM 150415 TaxID=2803912 RepID=UPI001963110F|nr:hypothetical protein [Aeromicrobium sp. YIM 150415]MBM9462832.1 hypothetical protein [Aeromicrobium sp. YIM 150415]
MKLFTKTAAAVSTAVLVGSLAACGGSDRPSQQEIADSLSSGDSALGTAVPEEAADCFAKVFHESDLSDDALQSLIEGDEDFEASDEDKEAAEDVQTDLLEECSDVEAQ